jgi:hypothetical protein
MACSRWAAFGRLGLRELLKLDRRIVHVQTGTPITQVNA